MYQSSSSKKATRVLIIFAVQAVVALLAWGIWQLLPHPESPPDSPLPQPVGAKVFTVASSEDLKAALRAGGEIVIVLKNGVYDLFETIEIAGSPTIRSESGDAADVAIRCANGATLTLVGSPTFENITVESKKKSGRRLQAAIRVERGVPKFIGCKFNAPADDVVYAANAQTTPRFENCDFDDSEVTNVAVEKENSSVSEVAKADEQSPVPDVAQADEPANDSSDKPLDLAVLIQKSGNGTLVLEDGIYELSKTLEIAGSPTIRSASGNPARVVIRCAVDTTLKIVGSPTFENVTVVCAAIKSESEKADWKKLFPQKVWPCSKAAVRVESGFAKFFGCVFNAPDYTGVYVANKTTNPTFEKCLFDGAAEVNVYVANESSPVFTNCRVTNATGPGAYVVRKGAPKFVGCKFFDGYVYGICVQDGGRGEFVDCEIYQNGEEGSAGVVSISFGAPVFRNCKIHDGYGNGVTIHPDGFGQFIDCDIYQNKTLAVYINFQGSAKFHNCQIHNNKLGVQVSDGSVELQGCEIYQNKSHGIEIWGDAGAVTVVECEIHHNQYYGVMVNYDGQGKFVNNVLSANAIGAWDISPDAGKVVRRGNKPNR